MLKKDILAKVGLLKSSDGLVDISVKLLDFFGKPVL
jgi:hypothetical protein